RWVPGTQNRALARGHQVPRLSRAESTRWSAGEATEQCAEDGVAKSRLRERPRVRQERWDPRLPAPRVPAVDDVAERIERHVLRQRQPKRKAPWWHVDTPAQKVEAEAEEGAVSGVQRQPGREPCATARDRLAEQRDIRVVAAEQSGVERLQGGPRQCGDRSC